MRQTEPVPPYSRGSSRFYPPSRPRPVTGGLTARTARGAIGTSWWSKRFIEVLETFALGSRLTRGRAYARRGQVLELTVAPGVVTARVQGSRARPYKVAIGLAPFSGQAWADVDAALAAQAIHTAALLAGDLPPDLEAVFEGAGARLFPRTVDDLRMTCSCPDWEVPCKHLAASFYLLAERFDEDPFEILHWRGRSREVLLARVRELRSASVEPEPVEPEPAEPDAAEPDAAPDAAAGGGLPDPVAPAARRVAGAADALAELPDHAPSPGLYWQSPVPLPPPPAIPDIPVDLLLRQLTYPPEALGGQGFAHFLRQVYAALPDPEATPPSPARRRRG